MWEKKVCYNANTVAQLRFFFLESYFDEGLQTVVLVLSFAKRPSPSFVDTTALKAFCFIVYLIFFVLFGTLTAMGSSFTLTLFYLLISRVPINVSPTG